MAQTNNTRLYPVDSNPELSDLLFGSNSKNFLISSVLDLINSQNLIQFEFTDGANTEITRYTTGKFLTNNNTLDPLTFTKFYFNKSNLKPLDLTLLFNKLAITQNVYLTLERQDDSNSFFEFKVNSIENHTSYFTFNIALSNNYCLGLLASNKKYNVTFKITTSVTQENASNKQDSLVIDGTGVKYPTVDAVNEGLLAVTDRQNEVDDTIADILNDVTIVNNALPATQSALDLKVDKVGGERLINASEITKLSNQSGSNTGDQIIPTTLPASDVYSWAKQSVKPNYTSTEVGAPSGSGNSTGINTGDQDLSGKENVSNKAISFSTVNNTLYPTVQAVKTVTDAKQNTLTNPLTGVGSQLDPSTYAAQDGTILYHSAKWFTPTSTVSTSGTTVTSVGTQFTSTMVGAKLNINGEWRIITAFTNTTVVTVASAYSVNYSGIVAGNWGVNAKAYESLANGLQAMYVGAQNGGAAPGSTFIKNLAGYLQTDYALVIGASGSSASYSANASLASGGVYVWANSGSNYASTKDLGLRRNTAGTLEIYDGITADGAVANRRDLMVRNLTATSVKVGDNVAVASAALAGTTRYRVSGNNSYSEMCMQIGASTYAWTIIQQNTW